VTINDNSNNNNKRNSNKVLRNYIHARTDCDCRVSYTHRKHQTMLIYCLSVYVGGFKQRFRTRWKIITKRLAEYYIVYMFFLPIPQIPEVVRKRVTHEQEEKNRLLHISIKSPYIHYS